MQQWTMADMLVFEVHLLLHGVHVDVIQNVQHAITTLSHRFMIIQYVNAMTSDHAATAALASTH
jgi:hypothetical protein